MNSATILIVEDEALAGIELQESLEKAGYNVPEVINSSDLIMSALVKYKPDLVLMDINLNSFTDGVSAVQRMKILGDTPVMYLTAYKDEETRTRAMSTNPVDYLIKPVSEDVLFKAVEKALNL